MAELNLLKNYPQIKRNLELRIQQKTAKVRHIARKFGKEYFDGDRKYGYGGYYYHPRFWQLVIPDFQSHYHLTNKSTILDVGCGKGFMLYDFTLLIPGIHVAGVDISSYAVSHALSQIRPFLKVVNAIKLPYPDHVFDLVISINTIHNLPIDKCRMAIAEIQRVSRKHAFITVDAYRDDLGKKAIAMWNLTAKTILHVDKWIQLFQDTRYTGDYYWFMP